MYTVWFAFVCTLILAVGLWVRLGEIDSASSCALIQSRRTGVKGLAITFAQLGS